MRVIACQNQFRDLINHRSIRQKPDTPAAPTQIAGGGALHHLRVLVHVRQHTVTTLYCVIQTLVTFKKRECNSEDIICVHKRCSNECLTISLTGIITSHVTDCEKNVDYLIKCEDYVMMMSMVDANHSKSHRELNCVPDMVTFSGFK